MSDDLSPLADLPADMPEGNAREYGAALVRNGGNINEINAALAKRNAAPLNTNSAEMVEFTRDKLMRDDSFIKRWNEGDPSAIDQLNMLDVKIARASGKLTDRDMAPGDYNLKVGLLVPDLPDADADKFNEGFAKLAADLKLPEVNAQALVAQHVAAVNRMAGMTNEEREDNAMQQTAMLRNVLGEDADAKIKTASTVLSRVSGRSLDISDIVKSNGAEVALTLVQQAEHLKAIGRA